jgi:hypothetical protein
MCLVVHLAGFDKAALRLVVLPRRGAVALAFVLLCTLLRLFVFGHVVLLCFLILR